MIKVRELDALIADIMKSRYKAGREGGLQSLRSELEDAGLVDPEADDLPDAAYLGGARVLKSTLIASERASIQSIGRLLTTLIEVIANKPGGDNDAELLNSLRQARDDFAFTATVAYKALLDVDYAYIAETILSIDAKIDSGE